MMMMMIMMMILIINIAERDASVLYDYYKFKYIQKLWTKCVELITF